MNQGIALLDEALDLGQRERAALESGEYDEAIEMATKRGQLTGMAFNMMKHAEEEPYRSRLLELSRLQKTLTELATNAHDSVRKSLNRSRMEQKRMRGYHMAVSHALQ